MNASARITMAAAFAKKNVCRINYFKGTMRCPVKGKSPEMGVTMWGALYGSRTD